MDNPGYIALTRQSGLMREMRVIANNVANMSTTGFRQSGLIFSEHVKSVSDGPSLSMANGNVRDTSFIQGALMRTNGAYDLAIEGPGFFLVATPRGERLTRAGGFTPNAEGDLVTMDGYRLLDAGRAPIFIPPDAKDIAVGSDGTLSRESGPIGQIGLYQPTDRNNLIREDGVFFRSDNGIEPVTTGRVLQGFLEGANVDPLTQIARMIEVQRAYEMGQKFLEAEDERIRSATRTFVK